jgi:2',5'-phosphodiesterase
VQEPLPLPSEEELQGWIPSARFPSDHLSLAFDFTWRPTRQPGASPSTGNATRADTQKGPASTADSWDAGAVHNVNVSDREQNGTRPPAARGTGQPGGASGQGTSAGDITLQPACCAGTQAQQQAQAVTGCNKQRAPLESSASAAGYKSSLRADGGSHAAQGAVFPADVEHIAEAADALGRGDIVALPTDTLYGLAACANNQQVRPAVGPSSLHGMLCCMSQLGVACCY